MAAERPSSRHRSKAAPSGNAIDVARTMPLAMFLNMLASA
jgi:hypothetical protein